MKEGQRLWTRDELVLAINLYAKIPFGKMHQRNNDVQNLAAIINRSPSAVARRLGNFASLDPVQQSRGIKGLSNAGDLAEKVWNQFYSNWDISFEESEQLLARYKQTSVQDLYSIDYSDIKKGLNKTRLVNIRVNQYRFRQMVMANFDTTCCITGIRQPELLIASHITSWSKFENNRLNPANGLCLNALHDKAFDNGLLTISASNYTVQLSSALKKNQEGEFQDHFSKYEGKVIKFPKKFMPNPEFLEIHNEFFRNKNSQ